MFTVCSMAPTDNEESKRLHPGMVTTTFGSATSGEAVTEPHSLKKKLNSVMPTIIDKLIDQISSSEEPLDARLEKLRTALDDGTPLRVEKEDFDEFAKIAQEHGVTLKNVKDFVSTHVRPVAKQPRAEVDVSKLDYTDPKWISQPTSAERVHRPDRTFAPGPIDEIAKDVACVRDGTIDKVVFGEIENIDPQVALYDTMKILQQNGMLDYASPQACVWFNAAERAIARRKLAMDAIEKLTPEEIDVLNIDLSNLKL